MLSIVLILATTATTSHTLFERTEQSSRLSLMADSSSTPLEPGAWSRAQLLSEQTRLDALLKSDQRGGKYAMIIVGAVLGSIGLASGVVGAVAFFAGGSTIGLLLGAGLLIVSGALLIPGVVLIIVGAVKLSQLNADRAEDERQLREVNERLEAPHGTPVSFAVPTSSPLTLASF
jgi:hypothetical protein